MQRKIEWSHEARMMITQTVNYWNERNQSYSYSNKILKEVDSLQKSILKNPYFLARRHENLGLYQRVFFKGKFSLYYKIEKDSITVIYFRSNKQKPV
jgi:hypothetical protein